MVVEMEVVEVVKVGISGSMMKRIKKVVEVGVAETPEVGSKKIAVLEVVMVKK